MVGGKLLSGTMKVGSKLLSGTMKHSRDCDTMVRMTKSMKSKKTQVMVTSNILLALSLKQRAMTQMQISSQECLWLPEKE